MYLVPFEEDRDGDLVRLAFGKPDGEGEVPVNVVDSTGAHVETLLWIGPTRLLLAQNVSTEGFKTDTYGRLKVERQS